MGPGVEADGAAADVTLPSPVADVEGRAQARQQANQVLLRRVQMLEQVLHCECVRHARALNAAGLSQPARPLRATPQIPAEAVASHAVLEQRLQRRRQKRTARQLLQTYLARQAATSMESEQPTEATINR